MQMQMRSGLERWQDGVKQAVDNPEWSEYDCQIKAYVGEYNRHLAKTPSYRILDWRLIKSMLWVETGAASKEWKTRPMQIGVLGDPGLAALLSRDGGGTLILPSAWQKRLTEATVRSQPIHNIFAGTGYLLLRLAIFDSKTIIDPSSRGPYKVTVQAGDSLAKIAKAHGTTIDIIKRLNGPSLLLRPGQILLVEKGLVTRVISGWRAISTTTIAQRYNGGGDPLYAKKLDYAFSLVITGKETSCALP